MSVAVTDMADALSRFLADNPNLPAGDVEETTEEEISVVSWPRLDISYERKGRGGRPSTIISGFGNDIDDGEIKSLAGTLRRALATGGSSRGGEILLLGDCRQRVVEFLKSMSIKARII